jgi:signal transduction histidine kinase
MPFEKINLQDIISEAFGKIKPLADKKNIGLSMDENDIYVAGDKLSIVELLVILLDNAVKYSHEESKIMVTIQSEGHTAILKVKDEGIGIKASDLPHIFSRFYRADISRSKKQINGYGLGLSIAAQIVKLHKGKIEVESKAGKGTTFIIKLPLP